MPSTRELVDSLEALRTAAVLASISDPPPGAVGGMRPPGGAPIAGTQAERVERYRAALANASWRADEIAPALPPDVARDTLALLYMIDHDRRLPTPEYWAALRARILLSTVGDHGPGDRVQSAPMTITELAERLDVSTDTIRRRADRLGIRRPERGKRNTPISASDCDRIARAIKSKAE